MNLIPEFLSLLCLWGLYALCLHSNLEAHFMASYLAITTFQFSCIHKALCFRIFEHSISSGVFLICINLLNSNNKPQEITLHMNITKWWFVVVLEKALWESLGLQGDQQVNPKGKQSWIINHWNDWSWSSSTLATWCEESTNWKRP